MLYLNSVSATKSCVISLKYLFSADENEIFK